LCEKTVQFQLVSTDYISVSLQILKLKVLAMRMLVTNTVTFLVV